MAPGKGNGKVKDKDSDAPARGKGGGKGGELTTAGVGDAGGAAASAPQGNDAAGAFNKMSEEAKYAIMEAAGLRPGPNVSLAYAVDKFRTEKMREVLLYIFFLFLFTTSTYLQRDVTRANQLLSEVQNSIMKVPFPNVFFARVFHDITTEEHLWSYLSTVIPGYLFEDGGKGVINFVLELNMVVQAPRLRQVRVQLDESKCRIMPRLKETVTTCFPPFTVNSQDTEPIPGYPQGTMIKYRTAEELETAWYGTGIMAYEGGGFAIDVPLNTSSGEFVKMVEYLKMTRWTDKKTRAVFFDFVIYNPMERLFLSVRLLFEFLPYGRINPVTSFRVMSLGLESARDFAVLGIDGVLYAMIFFYIWKDLKMMHFLGMSRYWASKWHWLNWVIYAIFGISLFFKVNFWSQSYMWSIGKGDQDETVAMHDFEALGWINSQIWNWTAFNSIFVWLKAFGYFKYIGDRMSHLASTVIASSNSISTFLAFYGVVVFTYAVAMNTSFGVDVSGHKSVLASWFQHCFFLMRKFEGQFDPVRQANWILGPLLMISFEMLCVFGLSKITVAILSKNYGDMKDHGEDDAMTIEFRVSLYRTLGRIRYKLLDILLWRKKDDVAMFRQERDQEMDVLEDRLSKPKKKKKGNEGLDPAVVKALLKNLKNMTGQATILQDKVKKLYRKYLSLGLVPEILEDDNSEIDDKDVVHEIHEATESLASPVLEKEIVEGNKAVLPPTWRIMEEDGMVFFFNIETRKAQWDAPIIKTAVASQPAAELADDDARNI